ncbi:hypothetical protein GPECTOR_22g768 [Gonium pectorale]|uniref:CBF1-interacting co-repressor CIR N-terminal domain-containing protein n=1 Tax=Gonium pectorale TaxID=33097 RepID=A0A150GH55_GONPE|nr:hypothetical protein GPECTOR_22g768 [Gonium pectorale]|eukprot:KXZ49178.1 hypothetical protein GPECTOR_22g768 [Gonium pectorale]
MGGHGGLNILPQKRWNVYNRDNRLKVQQDEAKAKRQEDESRERHEQAEREHRHQQLLRRTTGADGATVEPSTTPLEHINFWKDQESKTQHPENEKQQRDEAKRRGNPDTYTSDAKFDERTDDDSDTGKRRSSKRSKSKSSSKHKRSSKNDRELQHASAAAGGSKSIEQLRAERLLREKEERLKQRGFLASNAVLPDGPPQKEFNSAFGFAAALKRRRTQ